MSTDEKELPPGIGILKKNYINKRILIIYSGNALTGTFKDITQHYFKLKDPKYLRLKKTQLEKLKAGKLEKSMLNNPVESGAEIGIYPTAFIFLQASNHSSHVSGAFETPASSNISLLYAQPNAKLYQPTRYALP